MKKINKKDYKFYLLNKKTNKIDTGWEYKEDAIDAKKDRDSDDYKVYTKSHLIHLELDPDDNKSWLKESLNEDVTITDPQLSQQYTGIQKQIIDKQNQINQINRDILTLEKNKASIEQQQSAQTQKTTTTQPAQPAQTTAPAQPAQPAAKTENYHSISSLDSFINEALEDPSNIDAMDVLNVDDYDASRDEDTKEKVEKAQDDFKEDDDQYVFYVKVDDGGDEFVAKIYKNDPESDWLGSVKVGENTAFEKMSYETEYNKEDILDFLHDN